MVSGALGLKDLTFDRMMDGRGGRVLALFSLLLTPAFFPLLRFLTFTLSSFYFSRKIKVRDRTVRVLKAKQNFKAVSSWSFTLLAAMLTRRHGVNSVLKQSKYHRCNTQQPQK